MDKRDPGKQTKNGAGTRDAPKGTLSTVQKVVLRVKVLLRRKGVKHLGRAGQRFLARLGPQFAGAITYFSFLALVPILMVSFSVAGFVLNSNPDLLQQLQEQVTKQIPGGLASSISTSLDSAVKARFSVGIIGLVIALYSGISWMGNVRAAVQAQWRRDFDDDQEIAGESLIKNLLRNLGMLVGLGLALVLSIALSSIGNSLAGVILDALGLSDVGWLHPLVVVVSLVLAIAADVLIFLWVYSVLPPKDLKAPRSALLRGAVAAAVLFEVLKFLLTNVLASLVSGGASAAVFGPIIGLLAFFNLAATLVLFIAAWIATSDSMAAATEPEPEEVPVPAVVVREVVSKPQLAGMLGVGALLGFGWSRRRR
ncbi:membrane protein [Nakamurella sp. UYEF19]|uniref:inner membrane protein YhjD n=1 Tax=Nakamurella sp. UYEF19 TaxID=1756392 RepID=UPI003392BD7F